MNTKPLDLTDWQNKKFVYVKTTQGNQVLFNAPEKRTLDVWLNVYECGESKAWNSEFRANTAAAKDRIACLHIVREFTVGEGLE